MLSKEWIDDLWKHVRIGRVLMQALLCACVVLTIGCTGLSDQPVVDLQAERQALTEADQALFESHENLDQFAAFWANDAAFMPEGAPAAHGPAIRATWEQLISMPGFNLEWQATSAHVSETADMGYTIGTYQLTVEQDGTPVVTIGKYVTLWEKQADGSWQVVVDCFNSDGPPVKGESKTG